jgi:hypothetical protein
VAPGTGDSLPPATPFTPQAILRKAWDDKGRIGCGVVLAVLAFLVLRGCAPTLLGKRLPGDLETAVTEAHEHCNQDFPIWPGEIRMPTCDVVTIRDVGVGTVPPEMAAQGITRALCYHVDTEQLYWGEGGTWKHDMAWALRTYSKVAVLQDGKWVLFPDEDEGDRERWEEYACPGEYEASSGLVPRK